MVQSIISTALTGIMPYLAPIVFIVGGVTFADQIRDLIVKAVGGGYKSNRRT